MSDPRDLAELQERLGYSFENEELLRRALSHPSATRWNYQRLEYLGDAVAALVVAHGLFVRRGEAGEGELTQGRASLVKGAALADLGRSLGLAELMRVDPGLQRDANFVKAREKSREDSLEAVLAAVFLDGGYGAAAGVLDRLLEDHWDLEPEENPKVVLNELCQRRFKEPPSYIDAQDSGDPHMVSWSVRVQLPAGGDAFEGASEASDGRSGSLKEAERRAAAAALEALRREG